MKEINLKVTPLSEIDLRIDYEKSYVMDNGFKEKIKEIRLSKDGLDKENVCLYTIEMGMGNRVFYPNGKHYYGLYTLHLFYKDEKQCDTCGNCLVDSIKRERYFNIKVCKICVKQSKWIPIDSVSALSVNPHPIVIEYQDLGDTVKIVKIEGVMTLNEIKKHTGDKVYLDYTSKPPCMHAILNGMRIYNINNTSFEINIGMTIHKPLFFEIIETMKLASKRLALLIKESKRPKIERIEI